MVIEDHGTVLFVVSILDGMSTGELGLGTSSIAKVVEGGKVHQSESLGVHNTCWGNNEFTRVLGVVE